MRIFIHTFLYAIASLGSVIKSLMFLRCCQPFPDIASNCLNSAIRHYQHSKHGRESQDFCQYSCQYCSQDCCQDVHHDCCLIIVKIAVNIVFNSVVNIVVNIVVKIDNIVFIVKIVSTSASIVSICDIFHVDSRICVE